MKGFVVALFTAAIAAIAVPLAAQDPARVTFVLDDHPSLRVGSALRLDFAARVERDGRAATPDIGLDRGGFEWGGPRLGVEGAVFEDITFELSRDFGDDAAWKDAYVNIRISKRLQIEAGRFKVPFGRETLKGRTNLDFLYRSLAATTLTPSRDAGVMLHGRMTRQRLAYQLGYFARDGDNARTAHARGGGPTAAARLVVQPHPSLEVGIAAAGTRVDHPLGLRGETVLGDGVFFDRVYVNGRRWRTGFEAAWARGPVSLTAERILVTDQRKAMGFDGEDLDPVRATGWYVAGTWTLTGERKHGWVEPRRALLRRGIGALELAGRLEALGFDGITHPGSAFGFPPTTDLGANTSRAATFGINWYLDHYVRIQANVIRETVGDRARSPAPTAGGRFISTLVRMQFVL